MTDYCCQSTSIQCRKVRGQDLMTLLRAVYDLTVSLCLSLCFSPPPPLLSQGTHSSLCRSSNVTSSSPQCSRRPLQTHERSLFPPPSSLSNHPSRCPHPSQQSSANEPSTLVPLTLLAPLHSNTHLSTSHHFTSVYYLFKAS